MIELTPLDVRKKRGDFTKALRGYDADEVDAFIELVAERMEDLVKENLKLKERSERLGEQVDAQEGREQAVQEALVTAQTLRQDVTEQAKREAKLLEREARGRIEQMVQKADRLLDERRVALGELERGRIRFLKVFRTLLERELDTVEVESNRTPLEDVTLVLELGRGSRTDVEDEAADEGASTDDEASTDDKGSADTAAEDDADTADPVSSDDDEDADTTEAAADEDELAGTADESDGALEGDPAEIADVVDGVGSSDETGSVEVAGVEDAEDSGNQDSLWLSSILKRDQQETD